MKKLLLTALALTLIAPVSVQAEEFNDAQKAEIKKLFEQYIKENGGLIIDSVNEHQAAIAAKEMEEANKKAAEFSEKIKGNKDLPMAGNPDGDITMVEFFDYNCGYCRRALEEIQKVLENDKELKVIFMDMPILGPSSTLAAKWSLAAQEQGKYFEYHQALLNHKGQKTEKELEKLAKKLDLDVNKLKEDAESDEIAKVIEENIASANSLNIRGTPGFVIAGQIFPGFMPAERIRDILKQERAK